MPEPRLHQAALVQALTPDQTVLAPPLEQAFQKWARDNRIPDVDHPDSHYDYRGLFLATQGAAHPAGTHFPDTFKQHGHPTFSRESRYSRGPADGGQWLGETLIPAPTR